MEKDKRACCLWVNWTEKILSFHKEEGFAEVRFPNREEKIAFALEKSKNGFAIQ